MKRQAIFGGSFNPIHKGHINLCLECMKQFDFEEILLIPTNRPPHKESGDLASNADRMNMLRLVFEKYHFLKPSDIEFRLGGKSYTINTIEALEKEEKADRYFIIGSDMLLTFDKWKDYREILKRVTIIAACRHEDEFERLFKKRESFGELKERIKLIKINVFEVSSTEIRDRIKSGEDLSELLEPEVYSYIKTNGLYK